MLIKEFNPGPHHSPEEFAKVMTAILKTNDEIDIMKEHFYAIGFDTRAKIKYIEVVSMGTLTSCMVHPREVFRLAIMQAVNFLIVCHNHPSGSILPSDEDNAITKKLAEAGKIIGIKVLDHLIITTDDKYYSYMEEDKMPV